MFQQHAERSQQNRPLLIEGAFIVVSVLLGFAVAQYGEDRADRQLAQRALTSLRAELEYNLALALRLIDYDLVASLSEIYEMQNHLAAAARRTPMTSSAFFDPQGRVASLRQAQTAITTHFSLFHSS